MKVKVYLDSRADANGQSQLYFFVVGKGKRSKIFSGIKVNPSNWKDGMITSKEAFSDLNNAILQARLSILNKIISEGRLNGSELEPNEVKEQYLKKVEEQSSIKTKGKHRLVDYLDFYRDQYSKLKKENTLRGIKQVKARIQEFDPSICLEDLTHTWLNKYCLFLSDQNLQDSTIKSKHIKEIKGCCKEAIRNGIKISPQVDKFTWEAKSKQPFFATWEEVIKIESLNRFVMPIQEKARDLFILSCYTGLRNSDWQQINRENIHIQGKQKMLHLHLTKTNFDYSIPIHDKVMQILVKYDYAVPAISLKEFNKQIKIVVKPAVQGKGTRVKMIRHKRKVETLDRAKLFSSHTGRRTFGRRFLDKGGSIFVLSKIYGHKSIETTLQYIGYQPQEVIDEFNKVFG